MLYEVITDGYIIGLRPDLVVEVRPDILQENDGPTLAYAIMTSIVLPPRAALRHTSEPSRMPLDNTMDDHKSKALAAALAQIEKQRNNFV